MSDLNSVFDALEESITKGKVLNNKKRRTIKSYMGDEKMFQSMLDELKSIIHADLRELSLLIHQYDSDVIKKKNLKGKKIILAKLEKVQVRFKVMSALSNTYVGKFYDNRDIEIFGKYCLYIAKDLEKLKEYLKPDQVINPWEIFNELEGLIKKARKEFDEAVLEEFEHSLIKTKPSIFHILPEEWRERPFDKKLEELFKRSIEKKEASKEEAEKIRQYNIMIKAMIEKPKTLFLEINRGIRGQLFNFNYLLIKNAKKGIISVKDYEIIKDKIFDIKKELLNVSKLCRQYKREYGGEIFIHMGIYCRKIANYMVYNYYDTIRKCARKTSKDPKFKEVAMGNRRAIKSDVELIEFKRSLERAFRDATIEIDREYRKYMEIHHNFYSTKPQLDSKYKEFKQAS